MKLTRQRIRRALLGPIGILPVAFVVAWATDTLIERNFNMILPPGHVSFLRGSDDYGCSNLFAGATALYVTFGFLGSWYLSRCLAEWPRSKSFGGEIVRALWILKYHIAAFVAGAYVFSEAGGCDASYGNDFRNVFVLCCLVYAAALVTTVSIDRLDWPISRRYMVGPIAVVAWMVIGADGMTPKTWRTRAGDEVVAETRSGRHELMRRWYDGCERVLGSPALKRTRS